MSEWTAITLLFCGLVFVSYSLKGEILKEIDKKLVAIRAEFEERVESQARQINELCNRVHELERFAAKKIVPDDATEWYEKDYYIQRSIERDKK